MNGPEKPEDKAHVAARETRPGALEAVHPDFVREGLLDARDKTWRAFERIRERLVAGMTEGEARAMARAELQAMGSPRDWHKPYVRFGPGTALTFHDPTQREYRLAPGDAVYIDLGPVWPSGDGALEYEGDVGATFAFGENPEVEACAATARRLFEETAEAWRRGTLSGEALYGFLAERVAGTEYRLDPRVEGHRVADYPHSRYTTAHLKRLPFAPTPWLWVLEVQIAHRSGRFGAFFEDVLR
jgi:Xaa-Pro aminopeptidase